VLCLSNIGLESFCWLYTLGLVPPIACGVLVGLGHAVRLLLISEYIDPWGRVFSRRVRGVALVVFPLPVTLALPRAMPLAGKGRHAPARFPLVRAGDSICHRNSHFGNRVIRPTFEGESCRDLLHVPERSWD